MATGRYGEKCDVFSLGIVLVELFSNFTTGMERAAVLGELYFIYRYIHAILLTI